MISVLLVDDGRYGEVIGAELERRYAFSVTYVPDPLAARRLLGREYFEVVVADVLYQRQLNQFNRRPAQSLDELAPYCVSGLLTLSDALSLQPGPASCVMWTAGDSNRRLHLLFAWQEFKVRVFAAKDEEPVKGLATAIQAAVDGRRHVDDTLQDYLRKTQRSLGEMFFSNPLHRSLWRTLATAPQGHKQAARLAHYEEGTVRQAMKPMAQQLELYDPGINASKSPGTAVARFAEANWPFFLDRTVIEMYPTKA